MAVFRWLGAISRWWDRTYRSDSGDSAPGGAVVSETYTGPDRRAAPADLWSRRFTAWGSLVVTFLVFALLVYVVVVASRFTDVQTFNGLVELIKNMSIAVLGFWVGSSNAKQRQDEAVVASAMKKDDALAATAVKANETIASAIPALATSIPPSVVTKTEAAGGTVATTTEPAAAQNEEKKE